MSASSDPDRFERTDSGIADGNAEEDDFGLDWDALKKEAAQTGNDTGQPEGQYEGKEVKKKAEKKKDKKQNEPKERSSPKSSNKKAKPVKPKKGGGKDKNSIVFLVVMLAIVLITILLIYGMLKGSGNTMVTKNRTVDYTQQNPAPADPSLNDQGPDPVLPGSEGENMIDGANPALGSGNEPIAAQAGLQAAPIAGEDEQNQ